MELAAWRPADGYALEADSTVLIRTKLPNGRYNVSALWILPKSDCSSAPFSTGVRIWNDYSIAVNPREICITTDAFKATFAHNGGRRTSDTQT